MAYKRILVGFLIIVPVFVSIGEHVVSFDRSVHTNRGLYLISIPASIFLLAYLHLVKRKLRIVKNKKVLTASFAFFALIILSFIWHGNFDPSLVKNLAYILNFLVGVVFFDIYFKRLNSQRYILKYQTEYILLPGSITLVIVVGSLLFYKKPYFIFDWVAIYNFEQYFILAMLPLLAVSSKLKPLFSIPLFIAYIFIANTSSNKTALYACYLFALFSFTYRPILHFFPQIRKVLNLYLIAALCSGLLAMVFLYAILPESTLPYNLFTRKMTVTNFFNDLNLATLIFPFLKNVRAATSDMHNEYLEIYRSMGILTIYYYYWLIKKILSISNDFIEVKFSIIFYIFAVSTFINPTLHPYTGLYVAFVISLFSRLTALKKGVFQITKQ